MAVKEKKYRTVTISRRTAIYGEDDKGQGRYLGVVF